jgi:hypothetical protein
LGKARTINDEEAVNIMKVWKNSFGIKKVSTDILFGSFQSNGKYMLK